jgi:hypothetical protein
MFTSSDLYVLYCHITDLKLLDNVNPTHVDVLRKFHPLKYVTVHKAAYDHHYMIETFGNNQPNPILQYDNNPVPMTEDGKIDMPYLKALFALQPQKYGINTWLHRTGVYKYATEYNLSQGVSDFLRKEQITEKFHDMWFNTFREHSLSFSHWFEIYQLETANQIELAEMITTYQIEQDSDDWNDVPMTSHQPTSSSPKHQSTKVFSFGTKDIHFVPRAELTNTEQKRLVDESDWHINEFIEQTQIVIQSLQDQPISQKPGIASLVDDWMANEIRTKLMNPSESKEFIPFSTYIQDTTLNALFLSDISAEWKIFETQFDEQKPSSQAEITSFATQKLTNILIQPEDFLPNGRLAHVYTPNYLYLPTTLTDALDIGDKDPNGILSQDECFYIWSKARKARAKATQTRMFCKTPLLPFTPISPYFLWCCSDNKTYISDYDQHVAAVTFAISHTEMPTMLFYNLFIRPIKWWFSLNTPYGKMLRESIKTPQKAAKFVNLMIKSVASTYAPSNLDHERLFEEMTKIRHLSFFDLKSSPNIDNALIFLANHSPWPQKALQALPSSLTNEQLQLFINKVQNILSHRSTPDVLAIDHPDSHPIYDMFPEHGGIFIHKSLKQRLYELSSEQIALSPERTESSGSLNRPKFFISSEESSESEPELTYEITEKGPKLNIPHGILSSFIKASDLANIQQQRKRTKWIQTDQDPKQLLATTIADMKQQDLLSLNWFIKPLPLIPSWAFYTHTAYTFAKVFKPTMANEARFKITETSRSFPADDPESTRQIQIKAIDLCLQDPVIMISESFLGPKSLMTVDNCIFIRKPSLDKFLEVCIQTLNTILIPQKEDPYLPFGTYASRMLKDNSTGMTYFVDITRERMQKHGFRFVRIFQQTTSNHKDVGNVDIPWNHFDVFTRELNAFIKTPGRLATFFPKVSKLQRTNVVID